MSIHVGIDEAGYGPSLGPLVVGTSVFRVDDSGPDPWQARIEDLVRADPDCLPDHLPLGDSKLLYAGRKSLIPLEVGALAFLFPLPKILPDRLESIPTSGKTGAERTLPLWYGEPVQDSSGREVPVEADPLLVDHWRARLGAELPSRGIEPLECSVRVVLEAELNDSCRRTDNKAAVLLELVGERILDICRRHPGSDLRFHVDRQGGRWYYDVFLSSLLPLRPLRVLQESDTVSRYRIDDRGRCLQFDFEVDGDRNHPEVGLSSMCAKYVRELFMRRLNRHFQKLRPGLRPTAGYPEDAIRFLGDIEGCLDAEQRSMLVRQR